jgi:ATP synthase protein I
MIKLPQPNSRQRALAGQQSAGQPGAAQPGIGQQGIGQPGAGMESGISIASYPIGGIVAYGLIGWGIDRAIHASWVLPLGMLLGLVIGTAYVIYRYGTEKGRVNAAEASAGKGKGKGKATTTPRRETDR